MNATEINLHGILGEQIGKSQWKLCVDSVGDAMRGIQANTKKLYQQLAENDKSNIKYRVLINKKDFLFKILKLNFTLLISIKSYLICDFLLL